MTVASEWYFNRHNVPEGLLHVCVCDFSFLEVSNYFKGPFFP